MLSLPESGCLSSNHHFVLASFFICNTCDVSSPTEKRRLHSPGERAWLSQEDTGLGLGREEGVNKGLGRTTRNI